MQVRDHRRCALDGEALSDLLADAALGAGYDSKLPAKLWHSATPSRSNLGFARSEWSNPTGEIIVDDFAQSERQIGDQVCSSDHFADRQLRHRRQCVRMELESCRSRPRALERDVPKTRSEERRVGKECRSRRS